jgi:O-6-methylguanine DNA methyltransferase
MVIIIFAHYFKPTNQNIYILLEYDIEDKKEEFSLESLQFFKKENTLKKYLKNNDRVLKIKKDIEDQKRIKKLKLLIDKYFQGEINDLFDEVEALQINLNLKEKFATDFSYKVLQALLKIEWGDLVSYSELAHRVNSKAYRAVGNILRNNPLPLIIPCHRVVRKNGKLGGFGGETGDNWRTNLKRGLIKLESSFN